MSDYLSRLAGKSLDQEPVLQPRLASRYEPVHNQVYQPFSPYFGWASSAIKADDMESSIETIILGSTLAPFETLSPKDNQDRADDHSDSSAREESSALRELRSNRPSLKSSRALFNRRSPPRLKEWSNSNKAIHEGVRQQQPQQKHKHEHELESNGHDRSAAKKSFPSVARTNGKENLVQGDQGRHAAQKPLEAPVNPKGHARDRLADSTIQDLSSFEHIHEVGPGKADDKTVIDGKKEVSQAISPQVQDRTALIDRGCLTDQPGPLDNGNSLKRTPNTSWIINTDLAKAGLETISSALQIHEDQKAVGLSEAAENQILNEVQTLYRGQTPNKSRISDRSQARISGIKGAKTASRSIAKGPVKNDVSEDERLHGLDLVSKRAQRRADQGLSNSGNIQARERPDKEMDSRWPNHHDLFLENGMMLRPHRFWPAFPYIRISGNKEDHASKTAASGEETTGRSTSSEPQVQITIGRVEVRAALTHTPSPKKSNTNSSSSSLEEYLRKRSGGMRG